MGERVRFGFRLTQHERDREIARWIDTQLSRGHDVSEQIKDILYEVVTGKSAITGGEITPTTRQGEGETGPQIDTSDPLAQKLMNFAD